jgi:colanic acid/amylovoran biosynthesis glycosyltransferase
VRIAFVVGGFPLVSETWILSQLTGLLDRGHDVDIYARRRPLTPLAHPTVTTYGLQKRTRYLELPTSRPARLARALTALTAVAPRYPLVALGALDPRRYSNTYALLNTVMALPPFVRGRYDAILCHFGGNGVDFVGLKAALPDTRFVTMFHGDDYFLADEEGPQVFDRLKALGDAFLVTTDSFGRDTLRRHGFDDRRIATLRLAIAVKAIPFRERRPDRGVLRLVTVARLVPKKGIEVGLRAVAALRGRSPQLQVEYRVIGDGALRDPLVALARQLGVGHVVQFLGAQPSSEVLRCMYESDVYILPSLMEQAGYVLLEAQASGLPVVATRVGGVPEMVREGRSAVLVEPNDPARLAAAIEQLLRDGHRWPAMAREGRHHVEEHHDAGRLTAQLESILRGAP